MADHEHEHPKNRPLKVDDPMEMMASPADGDPLVMLDGIVEEYARMGWGPAQIKELFGNPFFQATHGLRRLLGDQVIERRIEATLERCGVFQVRTERQAPNGDQ